ncbi:MAG: hypothetical protein P8M62_10220 [Opitutae bacterium]|nr:hypothetical protein [Opitutae bacterium]
MKSISGRAFTVSENAGVLEYLEELSKGSGMVHPDISLRLVEIRKEIEGVSLRRCFRSQVLICPDSQVICAAAFGMGHAIKVGYHLQNSKEKGKKQKITWSDGTSLDLASQFGSDWIEGSFDSEEIKWLSDINPKANLAQQDGI